MLFYDIQNQSDAVSLYDAVTDCVTMGGGLYLPCSVPRIPQAFLNNMGDMTLNEIAYVIANLYLSPDIDAADVKNIVDKAFDFDLPLINLDNKRWVLELFHGPTMAFKDFGVIFMAELLKYYGETKSMPVKVVVASTGNTASAVANAFSDIKGVSLYILVPKNSVPDLAMPRRMPSMSNIHLLEVAGTIDDCKKMISSVFADKSLRDDCIITSSNSVNISRIIAQIALFFYAVSRLKGCVDTDAESMMLSLPCGNLSLLTSGILAKYSGLKCGRLLAACNANNLFDIYLKTGKVKSKAIVSTYARYMDTAMPLNLPRIDALYHGNLENMRRDIGSATIGDELVADVIVEYYKKYNYLLDPHAAVAMAALDVEGGCEMPGVVFATASPLRSTRLLTSLGCPRPEPNADGQRFDNKSWKSIMIPPTYPALKKKLLE